MTPKDFKSLKLSKKRPPEVRFHFEAPDNLWVLTNLDLQILVQFRATDSIALYFRSNCCGALYEYKENETNQNIALKKVGVCETCKKDEIYPYHRTKSVQWSARKSLEENWDFGDYNPLELTLALSELLFRLEEVVEFIVKTGWVPKDVIKRGHHSQGRRTRIENFCKQYSYSL